MTGQDRLGTLELGDGITRLRRVAAIVYASLALLLAAMPQQVADRLDDFEPNVLAHAGKLAAEGLALALRPLGVAQVFEHARAAFLERAGER